MPRQLHYIEPQVINRVVKSSEGKLTKYLEVATGNKDKILEISRILKGYQVVGKSLDVPEIQSRDAKKVVSEKAKAAYEANGHNPILVEDTSLSVKGLNDFPGTYVNDFFSEASMRHNISTQWLDGKDRSATARVLFGIYDGKEVFIYEGICEGEIAPNPKGGNGFGWDDIFIPADQPGGAKRTFAQMSAKEKDKYSMRRKALKELMDNPPNLNHVIFQIPEPFEQELKRVQMKKLQDKKAIKFAYALEALEGNKANDKLTAEKYNPISKTENIFFTRYLQQEKTKSIGLMLTDVDRVNLKLYKNGEPYLWQMGPERRHLALAERTEYFMENQNEKIHKILDDMEANKDKFPRRNNRRSITIEKALEIEGNSTVTRAVAVKEIGYKKIASGSEVSRTRAADTGLFTIIGKHARSIFSIGCLPWVSGWRDVITMGALGHMAVFVHRNNLNAIDFQNQIDLINSAKDSIASLGLGKKATQRAFANIGAALGTNPKDDVEKAKMLHKKAGVNLFRIYTINSDPRVIETARRIRQELGPEIELFVGQVVDKKQAEALVADDIKVDGLVLGHGGGRVCTSATNSMALSTLEEIYEIITDKTFNNTTLLVEGGLGSYIGGLIVMGADGILRNGQFANCVIEQSDLFFEHRNGKLCHPYHGSASAATMIIESYNPKNMNNRLFASGRARNVEGKPGYIYYEEKGNSMSFYVNQFKHYAARTLADLGVESIWQLREFLDKNDQELMRIVSPEASVVAQAWRS